MSFLFTFDNSLILNFRSELIFMSRLTVLIVHCTWWSIYIPFHSVNKAWVIILSTQEFKIVLILNDCVQSHDTRVKHWMIPSLGLIIFGITLHYLGLFLNRHFNSIYCRCQYDAIASHHDVGWAIVANICCVQITSFYGVRMLCVLYINMHIESFHYHIRVYFPLSPLHIRQYISMLLIGTRDPRWAWQGDGVPARVKKRLEDTRCKRRFLQGVQSLLHIIIQKVMSSYVPWALIMPRICNSFVCWLESVTISENM